MPHKDLSKALETSRRSYHKRMQDPAFREARRKKAAAYMRDYYKRSAAHRENTRTRSKKWREDNKEFSNLQNALRRYGLTLDQYHSKLESQDFLCALCKDAIPQVIDHNHTTGQPRGLLCWSCNSGIGQFKENLELLDKAKEYLTKWF